MPESKLRHKTMKLYRAWGYHIEPVDCYNAHAKRQRDFLGIADFVALYPEKGEIIAVQHTEGQGQRAHRLKKIRRSRRAKLWLRCGGKLHLIWWREIRGSWEYDLTEIGPNGKAEQLDRVQRIRDVYADAHPRSG